MYIQDTITAIATGFGVGAIGIIRISGKNAFNIIERLSFLKKAAIKPNTLNLCYITNPLSQKTIDQVLISYMPGPRSFTGEDVIEINCHGGRVVLNSIIELILNEGARLAAPGEFSKRAFLNGKIDLVQAEAIMDLISAKTDAGAAIALGQMQGTLSLRIKALRVQLLNVLSEIEATIDFPEDMASEVLSKYETILENSLGEVENLLKHSDEGQIYREGISVAIVGLPNVGKSSLLNYLLGTERAIVSEIPGTTRDTIEEFCNIDGVPFKIIDTAGIREISNKVEVEGIRRSRQTIEMADLVLCVVDLSTEMQADEKEILALIIEKNKKCIIVGNKYDLLSNHRKLNIERKADVIISLVEKTGLENLKKILLKSINIHNLRNNESDISVSNSRHIEKLIHAKNALELVRITARQKLPIDLWSIDIREALLALGEITGDDISDQIIDNIFVHFCIGK
ncbi:MAG: tRNA uridine-5-carboxymethylaminomethyl(34) synthesis GTPase MnmE [Candidatus Margulisiibacteriota bacterium]|nr:MAG: tRNA uridine-5-carboxymethylaminomethyl(34) synthesis GTPase MnmE [Candidatus Margulisbacteria bacterium GWD2_39_127]OGI02414.1 MAG: tRNA uridine-5-carboxymethylaminomethyl(34) synthesis GTPase MnmE [Candidatus Margulisbacteria bacterium GWF2_38_17]OGI08547.1 MAG: tRNA uridine-5-carboxymethylaminomethyl(34) synthesis GTPase MnmE [Candidatus Margulisbacteria bacterium GWE2_39_32]PZM78199.1 MAG: tRNA uridine-5-carboxymethylaminomethyl(34) synthesis GTPase MnmE [Candidatus Margulisiibacteri